MAKAKAKSKTSKRSTKTRTEKPTVKNMAKKRNRPKRNKDVGLRAGVKNNPDPGAMPTAEHLNPDSTKPELKVKHNFQPGDEIAFWPFSLVNKAQLEGREPFRTPVASCTVQEDGTINTEGMGKGKWVMGGPAGYALEDRYLTVTIK